MWGPFQVPRPTAPRMRGTAAFQRTTHSTPTACLLRRKKLWYYLPYVPVFCFVTEVIGVGVW